MVLPAKKHAISFRQPVHSVLPWLILQYTTLIAVQLKTLYSGRSKKVNSVEIRYLC